MGIFNNLFGGAKENAIDSLAKQELRLKYNVMTNISLQKCEKYKNTNHTN